jgi:hypothetical protein
VGGRKSEDSAVRGTRADMTALAGLPGKSPRQRSASTTMPTRGEGSEKPSDQEALTLMEDHSSAHARASQAHVEKKREAHSAAPPAALYQRRAGGSSCAGSTLTYSTEKAMSKYGSPRGRKGPMACEVTLCCYSC